MDHKTETTLSADAESPVAAVSRALWAVCALSVRRLVRSKFALSILWLGAAPLLISGCVAAALRHESGAAAAQAFLNGAMIRTIYLHFVVFISGWTIGYAVVRQEMDDQTLHYLFLQPVPRWVLIVGKMAVYLALTGLVLVLSLWISYFVLIFPETKALGLAVVLFEKGQFVVLLKESGVVLLGLAAYGAIGTLIGSIFKSAFTAMFILAWEWGLPYLPSTLKYWTVMHYLQSLLPVAPPEGNKMFELLGEPAPVWLCFVFVAGVVLVSTALCAFVFQMRECLYKEA